QTILAPRAARRDRADEDIFHRDDQVLERVLARLAHDELGLLQMLTVAARQIEVGRGHVDVFREREVVNVDLPGTGAAAHVGRARLRHAPAPRQDVDLFFVLVVARLALDPVNLDEHVNGHGSSPLLPLTPRYPLMNRASPESEVTSRPWPMAAWTPGAKKPSAPRVGSAAGGRTSSCTTRVCPRSPPP